LSSYRAQKPHGAALVANVLTFAAGPKAERARNNSHVATYWNLPSVDGGRRPLARTLPFAPWDFGTSHWQLFHQIRPHADRISIVWRWHCSARDDQALI
jgi:hypothetical protein